MERSRPVSGLVVAVFVGALALAGCGGGGSKANASATSSTSTTAANGRDTAAFQKYRDCLKQHGVDLPANFGGGGGAGRQGGNGGGGQADNAAPPATDATGSTVPRNRGTLPPGVDQQTFQAAQQACESLRPAGGFGGGNGQGGIRNSAEFRAYVSCLADHGVPVSTTTSTSTPPSTTAGGGGGGRPGQQFDRNDPHFASANQICMALLPQPSTTTTTAAKS